MAFDLNKELLSFWGKFMNNQDYQRSLYRQWKGRDDYSEVVRSIAADPELRKNLTEEDLK